MRGPWIAWLVASTILPASPFMLLGRRAMDDGAPLIVAALLVQLGCSIWLAVAMARKLRRGTGLAILMTFGFMVASVIVGMVSFFAACAGWGASVNFH